MADNKYNKVTSNKTPYIFILTILFLALSTISASADTEKTAIADLMQDADVKDIIYNSNNSPMLLDSVPPLCSVGVVCSDIVDLSCDVSLDPEIIGYPQVLLVGDCSEYVYSLEYTDDVTQGACPNEKTIVRSWTMYDEFRFLVGTCDQTITVVDNNAPQFDQGCPVDTTVDCDDVPNAPTLTATDDCSPVVTVDFDEQTVAGLCPDTYQLIRTWTTTDDCGNTNECIQNVYVQDTTKPTLSIPISESVLLCEVAEVCYPVSSSDNCDSSPTISIVSGPGVVSNGQWCYTPHQDGAVVVTVRSEDVCGNYIEDTFIIDFTFNSPPVTTCPDGGALLLCDLELTCIPGFSYSDVDDNIVDVTVIGGTMIGDALCFDPVVGINTITLIVTDECGAADTCETVFDIELNQPPTISCLHDTTIHWGDTYTGTITSFDPNSSQEITFTLGEGAPAGLSFNTSTGLIEWNTTGDDVCSHTIEIIASDECGAADTCSFTICVVNDPPVISCPNVSYTTCWGGVVGGSVSADDPDNGPNPLRYNVASFDGPGNIVLNSVTGEWSWTTLEENDYTGTFTLCIEATDGANICECSPSNADTCCISIHVKPVRKVYIEEKSLVYHGQVESVRIYQDSTVRGGIEMGGYDFLISYDATVLQFVSASPGKLLEDCGWEYFTYRYGESGNCGGSACPTGVVRITAIAEANDNGSHPSCFEGVSGTLANLDFLVTNDRTLGCMLAPIKWVWYDCGDNSISSITGDTLFISREVYQLGGDGPDKYIQIDDYDAEFPTGFGAPTYCETLSEPGKPTPNRCGIDYYGGGLRIICIYEYDDRADINMNLISYEVADAVLFSNYFIYGLAVFDIAREGQIAATDVNADGITLSVADLVYLIRVIIGDATPMPKTTSPYQVSLNHTDNGVLSINGEQEIGAAAVTVIGDVTPILLADQMQMMYNFDGNETRILIYSLDGNSFNGEMILLNSEIKSIEIADRDGVTVTPKLMPDDYQLMQNYPNPFNPSTTFSFLLPSASEYSLTIFNVNGQIVTTLTGSDQAGRVEIEWDASDVASGVYFYRLDAGQFSDTKKMILLK